MPIRTQFVTSIAAMVGGRHGPLGLYKVLALATAAEDSWTWQARPNALCTERLDKDLATATFSVRYTLLRLLAQHASFIKCVLLCQVYNECVSSPLCDSCFAFNVVLIWRNKCTCMPVSITW